MEKLKTNEVELIQSRFQKEHEKVKLLLALVEKLAPNFPIEKILAGEDMDQVINDFYFEQLKKEVKND